MMDITELSFLPAQPDIHSPKMFVGQIPHHMSEPDLFTLFSPFGRIFELKLLRELDGTSRGCCFVQFIRLEDAASAEKALHNRVILPPNKYAVQMKMADFSIDRCQRKLFVGMLSHCCDEIDLRNMFERFGALEDCTVLREIDGVSSRGCAFVTFMEREGAAWAIREMNGKFIMEGCTGKINVKLADGPEVKVEKRRLSLQVTLGDGGNMDSFGGNVGGGKYFAPKFRRSLDDGQVGKEKSNLHQGLLEPLARWNSSDHIDNYTEQKTGPVGANIFVYHLPNHYKDADLFKLFKTFGKILSVKVFVDKQTQLSKCFGFVSYEEPHKARKAIDAMNGFELKINELYSTGTKKLKVQLKRETDKF